MLDETLDDLRAEADLRRAIIAAYARLERVARCERRPRVALRRPRTEYLPRVLDDLALDSRAVRAPDGALHTG